MTKKQVGIADPSMIFKIYAFLKMVFAPELTVKR